MSQSVKKTAELSSEEKRALLAKLLREKASAGSSPGPFVHRLIEAAAGRTPDAVAVSFEDEDWSYRELDERSNQLANYLRTLGAGPETRIGLCVDRSFEMLVGLLGILKAGAAYVPLDPDYPADRLAYMLSDSKAPLLLSQERLSTRLPETSARLVQLDRDWPEIEKQSSKVPSVTLHPENLAYVLYTSGSTGRPKGVQIPHRALANFLRSMQKKLEIKADDVLMAVTTLSFDISGLELFLPLTIGARVFLVSRATASDGARLIHHLDHAGVTFLQATPATWRLVLESGWKGNPAVTMLCGGEALPRELADRLLGKGAALWNMYGPTETTIWSSMHRIEPGEGPVSIGRPIDQTQLYVLDTYLRPVPVGVTGELYIGGAGLARGYLGRPDLTAERFVPDPVGQTAGARLYATGDLARWKADGSLECLGRIDHQVKVRGFRIELGEIEAALLKHPAVREAAVIARDDASGEKNLVAYVVFREATAPTAGDLRQFLHESLPEYMVPPLYVVLDALPLTPNRKIDRQALPAPEQARLTQESRYVPPRGPIEEALVGIWADVIGREGIGVEDNFFEVGGHSLIATQLFARIRATFGVDLSLGEFFESATIAWLGRRIEEALRLETGLSLPPLERISRDQPIPASFAQQRLWFLDQLEPGSASYNITTPVRLAGRLNADAIKRALNEVVARHEALRTTFVAKDGVPWQAITPTLEIPLPITDLSGRPDAERESEVIRLLEEEARRPFDLARGPLVRAALLRLGDEDHAVIVNMHHIISDGWSIGVLVREVGALYAAFVQDLPSPLPELPIQYADFSVWQRGWLKDDVLQAQLDYWKNELAGIPVLELPTDRPRPAIMSQRGGDRAVELPKSLVADLRKLSAAEGSTLFMTLLTAFHTLLHRYSGQNDIAVGTPIAGRTRTELEPLVGFFVNTLIIRGDLAGNPTFRTLLQRVRKRALSAYAHQDLPFEKLVGVLHPERDPSRSPIFQVMFAMQNAPLPTLTTDELTMTPLFTDSGTAKFDLTLITFEHEQGLRAWLEYNSDLFDGSTAERMLRHLQTLLEGIVVNPDQPIATLPMLSEEEQRQLLQQWNEEPAVEQADLDQLSDDELDAMLSRLESGTDA